MIEPAYQRYGVFPTVLIFPAVKGFAFSIVASKIGCSLLIGPVRVHAESVFPTGPTCILVETPRSMVKLSLNLDSNNINEGLADVSQAIHPALTCIYSRSLKGDTSIDGFRNHPDAVRSENMHYHSKFPSRDALYCSFDAVNECDLVTNILLRVSFSSVQ